jgi:alpha-tubulin suppressor-like RCC1 family protein
VLYSWGIGTDGQLGHAKYNLMDGVMGAAYHQEEPRKVLRSKRFTKVAIGDRCSLALNADGQVFGAGAGLVDFSGTGKQVLKEFTHLPFPGEKRIVDVSIGPKHASAIDSEGKVYMWGANGSWFRGGGQLGLGHRDEVTKPTPLTFLSEELAAKVAQVQCGERHSLFLLDDGDVLASGVGEYGRLGTGDNSDSLTPTPINAELVAADDHIVQIAAGWDHSLALTQQGAILSWGRNQSGQLGHSDSYIDMYSMEDLPRPVKIPDLPNNAKITSIATGNARSLCVSDSGDVWIWGARLSHFPQKIDRGLVFHGEKVLKAVIGGDSSRSAIFFLLESGQLYVQGDNSSDMLGRAGMGRMGKVSVPERIASLTTSKDGNKMKVVDVFAGCGQHVFARVNVQA